MAFSLSFFPCFRKSSKPGAPETEPLVLAEEGRHYNTTEVNHENYHATRYQSLPPAVEISDEQNINRFAVATSSQCILSVIEQHPSQTNVINFDNHQLNILQQRLLDIEEVIERKPKLPTEDWQKLPYTIPDELQDHAKRGLSDKVATLFNSALGGISLGSGSMALFYGIASNVFKYRIKPPILLPLDIGMGIFGAILLSRLRAKSIYHQEKETLAKIAIDHEAAKILTLLIAKNHHVLETLLIEYEIFKSNNSIPSELEEEFQEKLSHFAPKNFFETPNESFSTTFQQQLHRLYNSHEDIMRRFLSTQDTRYHQAALPEEETSFSWDQIIIKLLASLGTTGGIWGGITVAKDSYDQEGNWWTSLTSFIILFSIFATVATLNFRENAYEKHQKEEHAILTSAIKLITKLKAMLTEVLQATNFLREHLLALKNYNTRMALPEPSHTSHFSTTDHHRRMSL